VEEGVIWASSPQILLKPLNAPPAMNHK